MLKAIDDSEVNTICLTYDSKPYYGINTSRSYATLNIDPIIDIETQKKLIFKFNDFLNFNRLKYSSLFLSNYREGKNGFLRKRISFNLVYNLCSYLLENLE